jgi:peroxiredoxin
MLPLFERHSAALVAISTDGIWCHGAFAAAHRLSFPLLADSVLTALEALDSPARLPNADDRPRGGPVCGGCGGRNGRKLVFAL